MSSNTLPAPQKSHHLDLTKQIAGNKLFNAVTSFSFPEQPCCKTHPVVAEKMLICFRRVKLLACIKQRKHLRRFLKLPTLGEGLSNALLKTERIPGSHYLQRNVEGKKIFNDRHQQSLKCLVRSNRK